MFKSLLSIVLVLPLGLSLSAMAETEQVDPYAGYDAGDANRLAWRSARAAAAATVEDDVRIIEAKPLVGAAVEQDAEPLAEAAPAQTDESEAGESQSQPQAELAELSYPVSAKSMPAERLSDSDPSDDVASHAYRRPQTHAYATERRPVTGEEAVRTTAVYTQPAGYATPSRSYVTERRPVTGEEAVRSMGESHAYRSSRYDRAYSGRSYHKRHMDTVRYYRSGRDCYPRYSYRTYYRPVRYGHCRPSWGYRHSGYYRPSFSVGYRSSSVSICVRF